MADLDAARVLAESLSEAINLAAALQAGVAPAPELLRELLVAADTFVTAHAEAASPSSRATVYSGDLDLEHIAKILEAIRAILSQEGLTLDQRISELSLELLCAFPSVGTIVDPGMAIAYELAEQLGPISSMPSWLDNPADCAGIVLLVEDRAMKPVMDAWRDISAHGYNPERLARGFAEGFSTLAEDPESAPNVEPALQRQNLLLRLWSGCVSAAKMISDGTQSGPNTLDARAQAFREIDLIASHDPVYRAGVVAAPTFKKRRAQHYSFDGVPERSPVRVCPA